MIHCKWCGQEFKISWFTATGRPRSGFWSLRMHVKYKHPERYHEIQEWISETSSPLVYEEEIYDQSE